jgi:fermentation-respiration switch protein FrsA (DUF1100 family)
MSAKPIEDAPRARTVAWRVLRPFLIAYVVVLLLMTFLETWLVYPIPPIERGDWQPQGLAYEDVRFEAADGTKLHGWLVPHPQPKRAIVYFHGNGESVGDNADLVAYLSEVLEASIFIFDYRGYGHSEGRPDEAGCIADGLAAQHWLADRLGVKPSDLVLMGSSLGSAVAVAAAAEQGAQALVLRNAFSQMTDVAAYHYPWLPVRLVMQNRYDSLARIGRYNGPLLQSHGTADFIVPIEIGRRLFDAAPSKNKRFIAFPDVGHNDPTPRSYYRELAAFLDQIGLQNSAPSAPSSGVPHHDGG